MNYFFNRKKRGFTLIEIIVVIGIIAVLTAVVLASVGEARKKARDNRRMSDLKQIELALKLYVETHDEYPCDDEDNCSNPAQTGTASGPIGEGGHIDTLLSPFFGGTVAMDPRGPGATYRYYIDADQSCGGNVHQLLIFARTMETDKYRNADDTICSSWGGAGGAGEPETHMVVIGPSSDN